MKKLPVVILFYIVFAFSIFNSIKWATISPTADFATFYCAGRIILDPTIPNAAVYDQDIMKNIGLKYNIKISPDSYLYSIIVAYIISPFTLLPYEVAKKVFNVFNIFMYLSAVAIALYLGGTFGIKFIGFLALSLLWVPFVFDQFWLQSNAIVSLFVAIGVLSASRNRPIISGILFAVPTLFKIFPFYIAAILGMKNWRIFAVCTSIFAFSLLIPGNHPWFSAVLNTNHANYTEIYRNITTYGSVWGFFCYFILMGGITAAVAYKANHLDYAMLASLAIPAALLMSPVVGGYYLVLLIFSFAYLFAINDKIPWVLKTIFFTSFCTINITLLKYDSFVIGLLIFWAGLIWWLNYQTKISPKKKLHRLPYNVDI